MTTKQRQNVPKRLREKVLGEYHHRCAICGSDRPQLHHIDEDPSNNDELNLLPLCPSCHLTELHDPTRPIDARRLRLFRTYRDPLILRPEFLPLYRRIEFLHSVDVNDESTDHLQDAWTELVDFVRALKMGDFYAKRIEDLLKPPGRVFTFRLHGGPDPESERARARANREDREQIRAAAAEVIELVVELLRYQEWHNEPGGKSV